MICYYISSFFNKMEETFQSNTLDWSSLVLLRFPTLVGNLSVFVLSFIIKVSDFSRKPFCFRSKFSVFVVSFIKVSDVSRKPFCFRCVFSLLRFPTLVGNLSVFVLSFLIIILYSLFFIFLLYFPHHCPFITSSIFNRLTSNFQQIFRITRLLLLLDLNEIGPGAGTGRGLQIWYTL